MCLLFIGTALWLGNRFRGQGVVHCCNPSYDQGRPHLLQRWYLTALCWTHSMQTPVSSNWESASTVCYLCVHTGTQWGKTVTLMLKVVFFIYFLQFHPASKLCLARQNTFWTCVWTGDPLIISSFQNVLLWRWCSCFSTLTWLHSGIESIRCWKHCPEILVHTDMTTSCSCCRFDGCTLGMQTLNPLSTNYR